MNRPQKYRKKPVEIEAIQFTGSNVQEIWDAFGTAGIYGPTEKNPDHLILTTVHGDEAPARAGDWVIRTGSPAPLPLQAGHLRQHLQPG